MPYGGMLLGPIDGPHATTAAVILVRQPGAKNYGVMALASPTPSMGLGARGVLDDHAHAIVADDVRSLSEAKRLGEAWAEKFRRGLVLAPCACEDMVERVAYTPLTVSEAIARVGGCPRAWAAPVGGPIGLLPLSAGASESVLDELREAFADHPTTRITVTLDACPTCGKTFAEHGRKMCDTSRRWFEEMRASNRQIRMRKAWLEREKRLYRGRPREARHA